MSQNTKPKPVLSPALALAPIIFLIALLGCSVYLFGADFFALIKGIWISLSRTLEDSGTLTSALIPWNTCGAYMSATLGIATLQYAPFAFFNLLCPVIAIIYGYTGFAQQPTAPETSQAGPA